MLGPGETLPEFTLLALKSSDFLKGNALITLPLWLGFSFFVAFNFRFLDKKLYGTINALSLSIVLYLVFLLSVVLALFLPIIKMSDKLGQ